MERSQNVAICTCLEDISVPDAAKPSHLMAGHALNIQVFVILSCDVLSSLPDFVGQFQASVNSAMCTIRLSLTELRMFSASKNHSVPYKDK